MTPQQWQKIDEVFQKAVTLDPPTRATFLDETCAGDRFVRRKVEAMLFSDECGWDLIEQPALELGAPLLANEEAQLEENQRVGHYRIIRLIGRGGMGEVYLAKDERLNRNIALKLLPIEYSQNQDRLLRFEQEAQSASALNHPNILTIHEIGQFEGRQFIATEFVEGETLRERIKRGELPPEGSLQIVIQIAEALSAAHGAGIVHRDIKPENIMLRPDGYVKLLDFGLAKLTEQSEQAPKLSAGQNVEMLSSLIMGTVKYMSPEQARGLSVDQRSDIFSLGVVLYEMLTGHAPFEGNSAREVIRSIIEKDPPPLFEYFPDTNRELDRVVRRTLNKNPSERYQSIETLLTDLNELRQQVHLSSSLNFGIGHATTDNHLTNQRLNVTTTTIESVVTSIKQNRIAAAIGLVTLLAITAFLVYFSKSSSVPPARFENIKITTVPAAAGLTGGAAISPDGQFIAYISQTGVWLRSVRGDAPSRQIPTASDSKISGLVFSRDGQSLYFNNEENGSRALYRAPVRANGNAVKLLEHVDSDIALSPVNQQLAFIRLHVGEGESALMVANADGSLERRVAVRKEPNYFFSANGPAWSPDGRMIAAIFEGGSVSSTALIAFDVSSGVETVIPKPAEWPRLRDVEWLSDGSIVVIVTEGGPTSTTQIWQLTYPGWAPKKISEADRFYESISATRSDSLVAVERKLTSDIWEVSLTQPVEPKQVTSGGVSGRGGVCLITDGRIIYHTRREGRDELWMMNPDGSDSQTLTPDSTGNFYPSTSADGRYIVFMSRRTGTPHVWRHDLETGQQLQITGGGDEQFPQITSDGREVYYNSWDSGVGTVWRVSINGGRPAQVISENSYHPQLSPDGSLLAYVTFDRTAPTRKVVSLESAITKYSFKGPLARPGMLQWSPTGDALFFLDENDGVWNLWSQPLVGGPPKPLTNFTEGRIYYFAPSFDGKSLILSRGMDSKELLLLTGEN